MAWASSMGSRSSNRLVRRHEPTMPPGYKPPTAADFLEDQRKSLLADAEREGWGRLIGVVVLGSEIVYTFQEGARVVMSMPDGFQEI